MNAPQKSAGGQTDQLAKLICNVDFDSLDTATITVVKRLITDGIAVAIAGSNEAPPKIYAEYVRDLGCAPRSSAWGFGLKTSPAHAAYINGMSMHVLDFEPMSNPPTHAVSPTVPGVLALAEALQTGGRDVVTACAKGFEMQGRILIAANMERGANLFHTPGTVGLLGSAVAASHMLRLNPSQLTHALGTAASRCSGISANTGTMVKSTHCGNATAAGVEAALLAQRGFTAHPAILEAEEGYVETFFRDHFDYDALLAYGRPYRCVDPGMAIKFYPSKYPTNFAISAALDLRPLLGEPARIRKVRILTPEIEDSDRPQPRSGLEGKYSFQYTVAAALLDGRVNIATFTDERRFSKDLVTLLGKISVERNPKLSRDTRKLRVEVEATLEDGTVHSKVCTNPPGFWGDPINAELHRAKIDDCLGVRLLKPQREQVIALLDRLEKLSAAEVAQLIALLG
jgi:aconitate decarboxylase